MKILLVIDLYLDSNNGTTISARTFANKLMEKGHEVSILTTNKNDVDISKYKEKIYIVPYMKFGKFAEKKIEDQGMVIAFKDKNVIKEALLDCDIVHFYMPFFLSKYTRDMAIKMGKPMTAAFHIQPENITFNIGLKNSKNASDNLYKLFYKYFYKPFTHIHTPSEFMKDELLKQGYGKNAKIYAISNGIGEKFKYTKTNKPEELKDNIVITMVGRLSPEKRQDLIINACKESKYSDNIKLMIIGKGPMLEEYKKMASNLKIQPTFAFLPQDKLIEVLGYTDIYIHSSDAESEAISCLEAMAIGLPAIISNSKLSATKYFATDERSLFEAGNYHDLAKKIDYLIENESERKELGKEYSKLVLQKYTLDSSVDKIIEMFEEEIKEYNQK